MPRTEPASDHRMPWFALLGLLTLCLHGIPAGLAAQDAPERPTLGLVLSGGGAKGFAHIGVLKVLEEAGIRPDYITGTSMGSIVGGLYAMGYSADSLERIALAQDWNRVLTDEIPLDEVLYEEKPYFKNQQVELSIDSTGILAPGGLVPGHEIERLLSRLTLPAYRVENFDSLPTPFRCMAVDLYYGVPYELSDGPLPHGIRASMAIPTIFDPVPRDTLLLVDGGLIRNFPVSEARALGADLVIGVHAGPRLTPREELRTVSAILGQTLFLGSVQDSEIQFEDVDLYIEPDILPYTTSDFPNAREIIARGEEAARDQWDVLQRLADSLDLLGPAPTQRALDPIDSVYVHDIRVLGNELYSDQEILGRAELFPGQWVTPDRLDQAITSLYGTNYFTKIPYSLRREEDRNLLIIRAKEKSSTLVKGTLSYDSYHAAGIGLNLTLRNQLMPASRLMFVAKVANNHRYRVEFLKYLNRNQTRFFEANLQLNRDRFPIIQDRRTTSEFRLVDTPLDLWVQQRQGANLLFGLGVRFERLSLTPTISENPLFERLRYLNMSFLASVGFNNLDRNLMPTRGHAVKLEGGWISNLSYRLLNPTPGLEEFGIEFGFSPYPRITYLSAHYFPTGPRGSLTARPFAGLVLSHDPIFSDFYLLGSPVALSRRSMPVYGLDPHELSAQVSFGSSFGYQYFPWNDVLLAADLSLVVYGNPEITAEDVLVADEIYLGGGLTAGYDSFLGPITLTLMLPFTERDFYQSDFKAFLNFGYRF